ncbi:MAG: hypothetical protein EXR62_15300 [Chloroflexi bacterium]|nr:hypothetical protein [Chloroflexota bacterium]
MEENEQDLLEMISDQINEMASVLRVLVKLLLEKEILTRDELDDLLERQNLEDLTGSRPRND